MIPLWQILEWFDMGTIDEEFVVEIFMGEKCLNILLANLMVKGEQSWLTVSELLG